MTPASRPPPLSLTRTTNPHPQQMTSSVPMAGNYTFIFWLQMHNPTLRAKLQPVASWSTSALMILKTYSKHALKRPTTPMPAIFPQPPPSHPHPGTPRQLAASHAGSPGVLSLLYLVNPATIPRAKDVLSQSTSPLSLELITLVQTTITFHGTQSFRPAVRTTREGASQHRPAHATPLSPTPGGSPRRRGHGPGSLPGSADGNELA